MIVVDSSAIIAILSKEPESASCERVLLESPAIMSALNAYETAIVVRRRSGGFDREFVWQFLAKYRIDIAPSLDAPLLFQGDDFAATDVRRCL